MTESSRNHNSLRHALCTRASLLEKSNTVPYQTNTEKKSSVNRSACKPAIRRKDTRTVSCWNKANKTPQRKSNSCLDKHSSLFRLMSSTTTRHRPSSESTKSPTKSSHYTLLILAKERKALRRWFGRFLGLGSGSFGNGWFSYYSSRRPGSSKRSRLSYYIRCSRYIHESRCCSRSCLRSRFHPFLVGRRRIRPENIDTGCRSRRPLRLCQFFLLCFSLLLSFMLLLVQLFLSFKVLPPYFRGPFLLLLLPCVDFGDVAGLGPAADVFIWMCLAERLCCFL